MSRARAKPGPRSGRLRRARSVLIYWREGRLAFENYLTRSFVCAEREAVQILDFFQDWRRPDEVLAEFEGYAPRSVRQAVDQLVDHTLLVREGSKEAKQDQKLVDTWTTWLPQASLHFSTKNTPFIPQEEWPQIARQFLAESSPPPRFKTYPSNRRLSLGPVRGKDDAFSRALLARRTHRFFSGAPVSRDAVSRLLRYTWGAMGVIATPNFGPLVHKTSPSGGARHPGEVYLVARKVFGLPPATYHYNAEVHALERVAPVISRARLLKLAVGQEHVAEAAAVFFMTASFPRSMWKYRSPRAYRVVTLDAGHLGQTFCLVATWLGLAPFTTAALHDTGVEEALGLDGITESVLYLAGVGMPAAEAIGSASGSGEAARRVERLRAPSTRRSKGT